MRAKSYRRTFHGSLLVGEGRKPSLLSSAGIVKKKRSAPPPAARVYNPNPAATFKCFSSLTRPFMRKPAHRSSGVDFCRDHDSRVSLLLPVSQQPQLRTACVCHGERFQPRLGSISAGRSLFATPTSFSPPWITCAHNTKPKWLDAKPSAKSTEAPEAAQGASASLRGRPSTTSRTISRARSPSSGKTYNSP